MFNAPAVSYPVGRSRFQTELTLAVVLASGLAQVLWWLMSDGREMAHLLGLLIWLVATGWAFWRLWHTATAKLVWNGQGWSWCCALTSQPVVPQVIVDVQHSLLLCLRPVNGSAWWVWPAQQTQPALWLALRRALFNPPVPSDAGDQARQEGSPEI